MSTLVWAEAQVETLRRRGISVAEAEAAGVRPVQAEQDLPDGCSPRWTAAAGYLPGLLFPWTSADGRVEWQIRPDDPPEDEDGRPIKYATRSRAEGFEPLLWVAKRGSEHGLRILTEGTCQTLAASIHAPADAWVLGMLGCRGWMDGGKPAADLAGLEGTTVVVAMDADLWSNADVWDAAELLQRALQTEGADTVRFLRLPAAKTNGLDDLLGSRPEQGRAGWFARLLDAAVTERFPKSRRPKPAKGAGADFFDNGGLLARKLSDAVLERFPAALTQELNVAVYHHGVYLRDRSAFSGTVAGMLGDAFRPGHRATVEEYVAGTLYITGRFLPDRLPEPILNCANGLVDLRGPGTVEPHRSDLLSSHQLPVEYDPDAACPIYEQWLAACCPDQMDDLEESVSVMLDPSRTPTKAVFLFGPARSGKSTFLRLVEAVAGPENRSSVSLHQLVEDNFAAANLYGKIVNVSADLKATHLDDLSTFKMVTGEDAVLGNRKYGQQFSFTNRALFVFSGNTPPTVGETSRAYTERMRPFLFPNSFAGREDPGIEAAMLRDELPGILARWVRAWGRLRERGRPMETLPSVARIFEEKSNRVALFLREACRVVVSAPGKSLPRIATASQVHDHFNAWAVKQGGKGMGRNKLADHLRSEQGIYGDCVDPHKRRGFNLILLDEADWATDESLPETPEVAEVAELALKSPSEKVQSQRPEDTVFSQIASYGPEPLLPLLPLLPPPGPLRSEIFALSRAPRDRVCEVCNSVEMPFGPAGILFACPVCHPETINRRFPRAKL